MNRVYLGIKFALGYFTLLPVRFKENDDLSHPRVMESMLLILPLIGLLLASITVILADALQHLHWLGALIAAVVYMVLYGFIHTEAICDVADAVHAAHGGKDPYTVIKEPHVGAMGVLYSAAFVLLKTASLTYLLLHQLYLPFLAVAAMSRLNLLFLIRFFDFRSTFVTQLKSSLRLFPLLLLTIACFGAMALTLPPVYVLWVAAVTVGSGFSIFLLVRWSLGFANGDVLGTALEISELIAILAVLLLWL